MSSQNYASTAAYFERRAANAPSSHRRQQLETAAARYRSLAQQAGHQHAPVRRQKGEEMDIPARRKRLMELFRAYGQT